MSTIAANRRTIDIELRDSRLRRFSSPALFSLYRALVPRLRRYGHGALLDVGCGTMPYRRFVPDRVTSYEGADVEPRVADVAYITDAETLTSVPDAHYDTVLCSEVLEHVRDPRRAIGQIRRVLRSGGTVILTVPHLSRLHEEPHDYYRYTTHGLAHLLGDAGFTVGEIVSTGSLFAFVGHQLSLILVGSTWRIPLLRYIVFALNAVLVTLPCYALDRSSALRAKFPLGYVVVATTAVTAQPAAGRDSTRTP